MKLLNIKFQWTVIKDNNYQGKMYILEFIDENNNINRPMPGGFVPRRGYDNAKLIKDYIENCLKIVKINYLTIGMIYDLLFDMTAEKDFYVNDK